MSFSTLGSSNAFQCVQHEFSAIFSQDQLKHVKKGKYIIKQTHHHPQHPCYRLLKKCVVVPEHMVPKLMEWNYGSLAAGHFGVFNTGHE